MSLKAFVFRCRRHEVLEGTIVIVSRSFDDARAMFERKFQQIGVHAPVTRIELDLVDPTVVFDSYKE